MKGSITYLDDVTVTLTFYPLDKKTLSYSLHTPNTLLGLVVRASAFSAQSDYKDFKKSSNGFPCLHSGLQG